MTLYIPARSVVPKPNDDDPLDYYYRPLTAKIYRDRLAISMSMLGTAKSDALLEVGYGSGILLPELARRTRRLVAIDIHREAARVYAMLEHEHVSAELHQGDLYAMPFAAGEFDALACFSVLEHLTDLDSAFEEFARVTRPGARLALGFPIRNVITDAFFRVAGFNPRSIHPSGHRDIVRAVRRQRLLPDDELRVFPNFLPTPIGLYMSVGCTRVSAV